MQAANSIELCESRPSLSISGELAQARIAIIDDDPLNVRMIRHQLGKLGVSTLLGLSDPTLAIEKLSEFHPDVVLLDVVMPELSGPDLLAEMRRHPTLHDTPVITLTASRDRTTRLQILGLGVSDFLNKPIDEAELSTRLRNVIEAKRYRDHLSKSAEFLKLAVRQRTRELEASRREVVLCLARAAEYRDDNTGRHVVRVGRYSAILAAELGMDEILVERIELAAQLHDVGKIGIPDSILHKPGRLTHDEMQIMRRHAEFGWNIIAPMAELDIGSPGAGDWESVPGLRSPMLIMAASIAASHHERWDGTGYPKRISGENIPLEARITAVADVFDALSTSRCYKPAFPLQECFEIVASERGRHFDPQVVDACFAARDQFEATYRSLADTDAAS